MNAAQIVSFLMGVLIVRIILVMVVRQQMMEVMEARHLEQLSLEQWLKATDIAKQWDRYVYAPRFTQVLDLRKWDFRQFYPELKAFK